MAKAEPDMPTTTYAPAWWDQVIEIYRSLGRNRFLEWAEKQVSPQKTWEFVVLMMAWNDKNSEFNLDRNIAETRTTMDEDEITEADVAEALASMVENSI